MPTDEPPTPAERADVNIQALWDRMNAHDISQNRVAKQAGITSGHLASIMSGKRSPSPTVLRKLHDVLFQPSKAELRVMPAEVKVLGWRKGERTGMIVRENDGKTARIGSRMPHGANVEFAYRTGYDGSGHTYVHHVVQRGCSALLVRREERA
ncbi:MAG: helix-turn-helix transcriptional regulator [Chloroflexi bacterium]|nr:helix-turn-helix transcriptional regulator [Chloroflexota bacterium]